MFSFLETPKFFYENHRLEEVKSFDYQGVCFTRRGVFEEATNRAIARSRTTGGAIKVTLADALNRSFDVTRRVYEANVLGTMLYPSPYGPSVT